MYSDTPDKEDLFVQPPETCSDDSTPRSDNLLPPPPPTSLPSGAGRNEAVSCPEEMIEQMCPPVTRSYADTLLECHDAGISAIPVDAATGAVCIPFMVASTPMMPIMSNDYSPYARRCPTIHEVARWRTHTGWPCEPGVGVITGKVSANLVAIKYCFSTPAVQAILTPMLKSLLPTTVKELLVIERIDNEGCIVLYRSTNPLPLKSGVLATRDGHPVFEIMAGGEIVKIAPCERYTPKRNSIGQIATIPPAQEELMLGLMREASKAAGCQWHAEPLSSSKQLPELNQ